MAEFAICCPAHGRHGILSLWLRHYARMGVKMSVCVSHSQDAMMVEGFRGATLTIAPNSPLSLKAQAAVTAAADLDAEWLILAGSDDFVSREYLEFVRKSDEAIVQLANYYQLDMVSGNYYVYRADAPGNSPIGVFRAIHRSVMDELDWMLWARPADSVLDGCVTAVLDGRPVHRISAGDAFAALTPKLGRVKHTADCVGAEVESRGVRDLHLKMLGGTGRSIAEWVGRK